MRGRRGLCRVMVVMAFPLFGLGPLTGCQLEEDPVHAPDQMVDELEGVVPDPGDDPVLPDPARPAEVGIPEPEQLRTLAADTVQGWTGPGGQPFEVPLRTLRRSDYLHQQIGQRTFALPARVTNLTLTQYPCTSCHEGTVAMAERVEDAHENIQPEHPARTGATCATCHVADSVEYLRLQDGETVGMDHAYQLCSQCHYRETESWAAGVHGKRLEGWHGRRVLMNCTDCHDPHQPAVAPRIPYPAPTLPTRAGGSP